jgi:hypothetical protein
MPKKTKGFSKVKAVKDAARALVGMPKSTRAIPDTKSKAVTRAAKHKKSDVDSLEEE